MITRVMGLSRIGKAEEAAQAKPNGYEASLEPIREKVSGTKVNR